MKYLFTTCALNYYPNARLLARSASKHLGNVKKILMIADEFPRGIDFGDSDFDEVWPISEIEKDIPNHMAWVYGHTVMELSTAIKGFVLSKLLARSDCESVIFLDPDCEIHSDLSVVYESLESNDIVLTPHTCLAHTRDKWVRFELNQHRVGTFNLGFLGVRNSEEGRHFAAWWWHRLQRHCVIDETRHLFTDQKWVDLVPSYFDNFDVLRQPTLNLARWNSFQRHVSLSNDGKVLVDGNTLDFIHYSGFLKIGAQNLGLYDSASEPWVQEKSVLDELTKSYANRLAGYQREPDCAKDWALARYSNGRIIAEADRRAYKMDPKLLQTYPNPFDSGDSLPEALNIARQKPPEKNQPKSEMGKLLGKWNLFGSGSV